MFVFIRIYVSPQSLDDVEDETLMERLVGLGEMFPEPLQNATSYALSTSKKAIKGQLTGCSQEFLHFTGI